MTMKKWMGLLLVFGFFSGVGYLLAGDKKAPNDADYLAQRQLAMKDPYANDLGPQALDVSGYPQELVKGPESGYGLLLAKCSRCHASSRPLNSQFAELAGKPAEQEAAIAKLKKEEPEFFKDENVWRVEVGIWQRYVRRMMAKPGCDIKSQEGKKIWEFLVYDSQNRKVKQKKTWRAHREGLLARFQKDHPKRFKELYKEGKYVLEPSGNQEKPEKKKSKKD
ncbi:MAG: hypothetical protein HY402_03450 [Elusimicrobia bacterium]|nr:hypothetical protein [Elusimicrobiota bacterium]